MSRRWPRALRILTAPFAGLFAAAGACGSPLPVREVRPAPAAVVPAAPPSDGGDVVALLDGRPVTRREVADHALAADGRNLIEQYIRWKVRTDRVRELGITNTPEELKARAGAILEAFRRSQGEEACRRELEEAGLTEEEYIARFAGTAGFSDRLSLEKAFACDLLLEESVLFDAVAFESEEEGRAFLELVRTCSTFDEAAALALKRETRVARWPRYRVSRGLTIESLSKSEEASGALFSLKAGEVSGLERTASGFFLVFRCIAADPPASGVSAELRNRAADEAVSGRVTDYQLRAWLERLLRSRRIEYKESYLPKE